MDILPMWVIALLGSSQLVNQSINAWLIDLFKSSTDWTFPEWLIALLGSNCLCDSCTSCGLASLKAAPSSWFDHDHPKNNDNDKDTNNDTENDKIIVTYI